MGVCLDLQTQGGHATLSWGFGGWIGVGPDAGYASQPASCQSSTQAFVAGGWIGAASGSVGLKFNKQGAAYPDWGDWQVEAGPGKGFAGGVMWTIHSWDPFGGSS